MTHIDTSSAVADAWRRQRTWSRAADAAKRRITRGRRAVAALTIGAAIAAALATQLGEARNLGRGLAIAAAAALLLVPVAARWTARDEVQRWTRLRSVAEALKADVHRYLAGVAPFAGTDREAVLLRRVDTLLDDAGDLTGRTVDVASTPRPLPEISDVPSYLTHRVVRQIEDYYLPMARRMARSAVRVRAATTVVTVAAALLSATAGVLGNHPGLTSWVGVAATVTTALVGYGAAQQYEHQQIEYARTADQLTRLRLTREAGHGWTDDAAFVTEAERIISLSNEAWMAKMIEEDGLGQ